MLPCGLTIAAPLGSQEIKAKDYKVIILRPETGDIELEPIMLAAEVPALDRTAWHSIARSFVWLLIHRP